jgi:flagellar basal-body rod protein FlgB
MLDTNAVTLERFMDVLALRQRVAASNIANADTPGYRAREVDFGWHMRTMLASQAGPRLPAMVQEVWGEGVKNDGNTVQLDREMQSLADSGLRFTLASVLLQKQIRGMRNVIREGRGG